MRRVGVEEEFLIVDCADGRAVALGEVLERLSRGDGLSSEMKQEQIETCALPRITLNELAQDINARRASADSTARAVGARLAAPATSPLPVQSTPTPGLRYQQMIRKSGLTALEQLTCGCHVHVEVESDEEGVAVLDRIRTWLPGLIALTTNSPYWNAVDSGYASYRPQARNRWPTAGAYDIFGSAAAYPPTCRRSSPLECPWTWGCQATCGVRQDRQPAGGHHRRRLHQQPSGGFAW